jgi:hypothetical protein
LNSPSIITIPPNSTFDLPYTINVPSDNNLSGTYWSLYLIQPIPSEKTPGGMNVLVQYGVQIITHVGEKAQPELKILNKAISMEEGQKWLDIDGLNTGPILAFPGMSVQLFDSNEKKIRDYEGHKDRLLPNCSNRYRFDISSIDPGSYKAFIFFAANENCVYGSLYDIHIPK